MQNKPDNFSQTQLNLFTEFSFLNLGANEHFITQKMRTVFFKDKEIIYNSSQSSGEFFNIIVSGRVYLTRPILNTNQVLHFSLGVGCIFGIENVLLGDGFSPMIISADGNVQLYRAHKEEILQQCKSPEVLRGIFEYYVKTLNYAIIS